MYTVGHAVSHGASLSTSLAGSWDNDTLMRRCADEEDNRWLMGDVGCMSSSVGLQAPLPEWSCYAQAASSLRRKWLQLDGPETISGIPLHPTRMEAQGRVKVQPQDRSRSTLEGS